VTDTPLTSTDPASLDLLFSSDPTTLSDREIERLVLELRRRRSEFLSSEATKALAPKKTRAKAEPQSAASAAALDKPLSEISLDDL